MSIKYLVLFFFIFTNYYNPISVYLATFINISIALLVSREIDKYTIQINYFVVVSTLLILIWSILIMAVRSDINMYVFGKYLRITVSTFLIIIICSYYRFTAKQLTNTLTVVFSLHLISIVMQGFFPQLDIPMAKLFGFDRESTIISEYTTRKLGCSSSYDTASLISISSMVFFFYKYLISKKNIFLLLVFISLLACTRSSRSGMVLGFLFFITFSIVILLNSKGKRFFGYTLVFLCGISLSAYIILPILMHSTNLQLTESFTTGDGDGDGNSIISTNDYTTGTTIALISTTSTHLNAMRAPISDILFGFGVDPNTISEMATDFGYVKLIYHVGIIGLVGIVAIYIYIIRKIIIIRMTSHKLSDEFALSSFLILYILLIFIMNYKNLEMYSRGNHEMALIIFFILTNNHQNKGNTNMVIPRYL